jgi:peptidoglycan hydrolase-like protein with peptidoglycan-binding domain
MLTRLKNPRWTALAVVVAVLVAAVGAWGIVRAGGAGETIDAATISQALSVTTATTEPSTTDAPRTTTTATTIPETTTTAVPVDDGVLERGESGEAVAAVQRRLAELKFDPGPADGAFGTGTLYAVQGFQKLYGLAPDGKVGPEVQALLADPPTWQILVPNGEADRVEVDLARQLLFSYVGGQLRLISHVSTGSGEEYCVEGECGNRAITPEGAFRFMWRRNGWREARLGKLYNPVYFTSSGVAVHGSTSVPTYPASHGCVRIPMHIAEYFPSLVKNGDAVYVLAGPGATPATPPARSQPAGPPPSDAPTSPDSTTTTAPPPPEETTTTTAPPPEESTTTTSLPIPG